MAIDTQVARRLFTREEYHRMAEVGILRETDKVELIRGEIITKVPQGRRHRAFVDNLNQLLAARLIGRAIVSVQAPTVVADDSEPEPDVQILRRRAVPYKEREAFAEDVLLLIEVSQTSLVYDRSIKLQIYAEAGIPDYWIVDCVAESIHVHRRPDGTGYRDVSVVAGADATVTIQAFPDISLRLADIFA